MPASTRPRVLTVEDDPIVRADLRLILEGAGFDVCPDARDGVEAVELARAHRPDLILIDLGLPRIDGVEATRRILHERRLPIVALTGHRGGAFVERAMEAGAVAHVLKPFHEAHLVGTITGALAAHGSPHQRDALALDEDEYRHHRDLVLIESMVRAGYSEREIVGALHGGSEWAYDVAAAGAFLRRILRLFRR